MKRHERNGAAALLEPPGDDVAGDRDGRRWRTGDEDAGEVRLIDLGAIVPSETNPRKHFDEAKLNELCDSIRAKGLLQPIIVRPLPDRRKSKCPGAKYEIVVGERRFCASMAAGLTVIKAEVRELSDKDAQEIQTIENDQREDLTALERARGYERLITQHGYTPETLAERIGKSKGFIYGLLKLLRLPKIAADAVEAGTLPAGTAQLIARIPDERARAEAARQILRGDGPGEGPLSQREAQALIHEEFMIELKQAPFGKADADLLPGAGACTGCPKMTGNAKAEYPEARGDICTDPKCFQRKVEAHKAKLIAAAKAEGVRVLPKAEAKKIFPYGDDHMTHGCAYVDLAAQCYEDPKRRSWKQLVGQALEAKVVLAEDGRGRLHRMVPRAEAEAAARREHKIGVRSASLDKYAAERKREAARIRHKQQAARELVRRAQAQVVAGVERMFEGVAFDGRCLRLLQALALEFTEASWHDAAREVCKRRGLEQITRRRSWGNVKSWSLAETVKACTAPEALALMAELLVVRGLSSLTAGYSSKRSLDADDKAFLEACGIDVAKLIAAPAKTAKAKRGAR